MSRDKTFRALVCLDLLALAAPTGWMGAGMELTLALVLATGTVGMWCWLRVGNGC